MGAEGFRAGRRLGAVLAFLASAPGSAHEMGASRYDYVRHVRPLLERHCSSCHRPGGIAPMSLGSYEEAAPWVNAIKLMVLERRMPPFLPEEGVSSWRGARGLSARELDLLVEWASGGAPKGQGSEEFPEAALRRAEKPRADLVLTARAETVLGPEEGERADCVVFPTGLAQDRAIVAVALWPGNERVVRSAVVYAGETCREGDRPLASWLPGDGGFEMPAGSAEILPRGASLSARILYRKTWLMEGKPARDRSRLALRFARGRILSLVHLSLEPGAGTTLERGARVVSVFPRGPRGATVALEAVRPRGGRERILSLERFDPDWRARYVLSSPLPLEAGTRLEAVGGGFWVDSLVEP